MRNIKLKTEWNGQQSYKNIQYNNIHIQQHIHYQYLEPL